VNRRSGPTAKQKKMVIKSDFLRGSKMMSLPLMAVNPFMKVVIVIWMLVAIFMVLLVLVQKGRGGGLGAAFGGAGSSVLGSKTGDFLTWVTISLVGLWLLLSVVSAKWYKPTESDLLKTDIASSTAPVTAPVEQDADTEAVIEKTESSEAEPNA